MIDNMYAIMDRINEIRGRFGLKSRPAEIPTDQQQQQDAYIPWDKGLAVDQTVQGYQGAATRQTFSRDYINSIVDYYAQENRLPSALLQSVIDVESGYDHAAESPKGARGLMQLMPSVMEEFSVEDPMLPSENIRAGSGYLRSLMDRYNGDYERALAAYNAGPSRVGDGVPEINETKEYVAKVMERFQQLQQRGSN